ncbi:hypothetical protein A4H97_13895 [Niastella yeongjuensis]|uniref:Uncharacterized protein n=1 Tax=Niastella yeongjuensis TaxID=354355 RepID=A0A1V9E509_9BACT|nr:DUF5916 domain-containing protein [Niastella yeongjuensis]OQP41104.1 hypothetical protein A4H97_13895 [Niastella yeongjuensis]
MSQPTDTTVVRRTFITQHLQGNILLDGIPNEDAWNSVTWSGNFTQWQPNEGKAPHQPTEFKILYDEKYLYIAYHCIDQYPDSIIRWMDRRDQFPGDWVEINIDSYHDHRTAFSFTLSVSGVRGDEFVSNNGNNWDANWNPIWFSKTHIDETGWTAEVKIPFSQLRYGNEVDKTWGIQVTRRIFRKEERSCWQYIPQNSGVWVSRFGELKGLKNIPMHRQVEIAPYVTFQADKYKKEPGNPFATGFDSKLTGGVDGKYAVTNDLILDFTVNPDFGQVEADPSQVRIDGFQNFFEERRPFFIESRNIFDYQLTGSEAGGDYDSDLLFYSRRIGSSPHLTPETNDSEYLKMPQYTSILGAAKFSGKTRKGWSIGVLESITQREMATIDNNGEKRKELVEPLTSYFVGRLQKDINSGQTIFGGIITAVNRDGGLNDLLHRQAYSGGLDFYHTWKNRIWYVRGNMVFSQVQGTKDAILNTQTAFEHLFQRTDARVLSVDSSRTALTGTGGTFRFGKVGGKGAGKHGRLFKFETGFTLRSPELELNDIGFMLTANEINHFTWAGFHWPKSFLFFRSARLNYNHWSRWDYSGRFLNQAFNFNSHAYFKNNWQAGTGGTTVVYDVSNNALRGTTAIRNPGTVSHNIYVNTDFRKKLYAYLALYNVWGFGHTMRNNNVELTLYFQPMNSLRLSLAGSYTYYWRRQDQFVDNVDYNNTSRAIVSEVKQHTLRFTGRLTYNITPDLTLQYYGQPYLNRPTYDHFAYVINPMAKNYNDRFQPFKEGTLKLVGDEYLVDEQKDGVVDYTFDKPDFNFVQFRSNFVMRWEYKRGSELYLVWSQSNTPDADADLENNVRVPKSLFNNAFGHDDARNIFLVKWTYRFLK